MLARVTTWEGGTADGIRAASEGIGSRMRTDAYEVAAEVRR
jgi:hypothetical protein